MNRGTVKRAVWGWAFYDWANSAFATTVMAGFFPVFFKTYWSAGADVNTSTAQLGLGNSLASLMVALVAPFLGAVADRGTARKRFLLLFAYLGVLATAALALVGRGFWQGAVFVYALGILGFSGANVFYDALLPEVADRKKIDSVSGLGYAMGYLGGGLLFGLNVLMVMRPEFFRVLDPQIAEMGRLLKQDPLDSSRIIMLLSSLDARHVQWQGAGLMSLDSIRQAVEEALQQARQAAVRLSFVSVAVWWGVFTLFAAFWVKEGSGPTRRSDTENMFVAGFGQFLETFRKIRHLRTVFLFLVAYWLYIDGVDTIIRMAVDYGLSLGFEANDLILALLITQFVGFPCAFFFGRLGERWGARKSIFLAIGVYVFITLWGMWMTKKAEFYVLAILIGTVQGGIQALSRSYFSRLIPRGQAGEFFGFYNMLGKFAAILGPALMGLVGLGVKTRLLPLQHSPADLRALEQLASRWSIGSILILFLLGAALFYFVDEEKGREEIRAFEADC